MHCKGWRILVTGASSGIGRATAELFAKEGAKLLLVARREDKLTALAKTLESQYQAETYLLPLDLQDRLAVEVAFGELPSEWRSIDVLVNNAGLALGLDTIQDGNVDHWEKMIDTNIKGVLYVTRLVLPTMIERNRGHIINMGSISSRELYSGGVVYCATKFALRAITDGIKMDVHGTSIRTTTIHPGMLESEFSEVRFSGDKERAKKVYCGVESLCPEDVADAVVYAATRPKHVDIREMMIYPTAQTASHLTHREE